MSFTPYILSRQGRALTWGQWRQMAGTSLRQDTKFMWPADPLDDDAVTLGEIADACPATGEQLARFAAVFLARGEFAQALHMEEIR